MSQVEDFALAKALREKLKEVENRLARNANKSPLTRADEQEMTAMQARADEVYVKAGRRAPPPLPYERPREFRRRLAQGLAEYSPKLQGVEFAALADDVLKAVEPQLFADAAANGPTAGLRPGEMRATEKISEGGHRWLEFIGGPGMHFSREFRPPVRFAKLRRMDEYEAMSRDAALRNIQEIARRPTPTSPRAAF
jgi:hypothetical protein